ncbi:MAG TPA: TlpA disulfide reductase family protein [Planctomycetota bacterium]|nr:TlpA disulfide reductase family protein [Planctomycetota bacterium]
MSRRTVFSLVLLLLVAAWFLVTGLVRAHVNDLIQESVGKHMPDFSLADHSGRVWTAADLKGKRAVLHFFRSRCHSCDVEAPAMLELEGKLSEDTVLLHVMTDAVLDFPAELTTETIAKKNFQRPVLLADAKFVDAFHQVKWSNVTPITYVVDAAGVIRFGLRGAQTRGAIEEALAAAR